MQRTDIHATQHTRTKSGIPKIPKHKFYRLQESLRQHSQVVYVENTQHGIPDKFVNIFKAMYDEFSCGITTTAGYTDFFKILSGVKQGSILSPFLFVIVMDFVMKQAMNKAEFGFQWSLDQKLTDLDFADDIALLAELYTTGHDKQSHQLRRTLWPHNLRTEIQDNESGK